MAYMDNSGLYVKIGPEVAVPSTGGEYKTYGELREIEIKLNIASAGAIATPAIANDNIFFPKGTVIQECEYYTDTATATGSTFDLGLIATDRTTEIDFNGILAAVTLAATSGANVGIKTIVVKGGTFAGALLGGSALASPGYLCFNFNTTAFTAGVVRFRIRYFRP